MNTRKPIHPAIRQRARQLRKDQTPMELRLWHHMRRKQLAGLRSHSGRQHPIGRFIVDFYCPSHKLIIEIDGQSHDQQIEYDEQRTAWLEANGYRILRYTNKDVRYNLEGVLNHIQTNAHQTEQPGI